MDRTKHNGWVGLAQSVLSQTYVSFMINVFSYLSYLIYLQFVQMKMSKIIILLVSDKPGVKNENFPVLACVSHSLDSGLLMEASLHRFQKDQKWHINYDPKYYIASKIAVGFFLSGGNGWVITYYSSAVLLKYLHLSRRKEVVTHWSMQV